MYKIPGIVSLIQKKKKFLTSEDVVTIGCQIWKNKENPALLKCVCPPKDPNYVFDPYDPDLPKRIKRRYKKSKEIQHGNSDDEEYIDLECGIPNKRITNVSAQVQQSQKAVQYKESGQDYIQNPETGSFWTDLANVVFGTDEIQIENNKDYRYNDIQNSYQDKKYNEVRVQYNRNKYFDNPERYETYNNYGAQLHSIRIV